MVAPCLNAAELFGVQLSSATLDQLRTVVKQAGATLISESNDEQPYDVYESGAVLAGSSRLYLGHVGGDRRFAFVEYEFIGLKRPDMLRKLSGKYGSPEVRPGKFISDNSYYWDNNGIGISLYSDWRNYHTRLIYADPVALGRLKQAQRQPALNDAESVASNY